jgi:multidrug efflux pump
MNFSLPFILRPIGTTLLAAGLFLLGAVAYLRLPVASLPAIEFPTIRVSANRPGADPATMAATVAAPLERRLGEIAGVTQITSTSGVGNTSIVLQFDLSRKIDGAARDVQAALNAASQDLPGDLPTVPTYKKLNPSAAPVLILALTSETLRPSAIYDAADSIIAQRISQVPGVADVNVSGAEQPAIRIRTDPGRLAAMGVSADDVRQAIAATNAAAPIGAIDGADRTITIATNDQLKTPTDYADLVVKRTATGDVVRLSSVASISAGTRNSRSAAMFNHKPAVLLIITKQADANVIETVDAIKALLPEFKRWVPAGIDITVLNDRTTTIRASVADMQITLGLAVLLVMLVVLVFLRRATPTIAAGVTVPLSLAGTCAAMWLAGYSVNNLTLMALAVSVGFVVDDAIVMIENVVRNLEQGKSPMQAAIEGARQIGFTVVSISVSLLAAFIPLIFMGGVVGRLLREFSLTLVFAIAVSTVVSLSVTAMICAHFLKLPASHRVRWYDRVVEGVLDLMLRGYRRTLAVALRQQFLTIVVMLATLAITVHLYRVAPKGYFPQDDTGLIISYTEAAPQVSYEVMKALQTQAIETVLKDPAVARVGSSIGATGFNASVNQGRMFISLKPLQERGGKTTNEVINRLRHKVSRIVGLSVFMFPAADIRVGGRQSKSQYQFTLWDTDFDELIAWAPKVVEALRKEPELTDVSTDREQGGLQANVIIDRTAAARLGVRIEDIDSALNNSFSQRQISTIYGPRNQYQVVLEIDPRYQKDLSDFSHVYVPSRSGAQVPILSVIDVEQGASPLVVNHQGPFPAVTITYNLKPGSTLDAATRAIDRAIANLHLPETIRAEAAGDARDFAKQASAQPLLILAALIAVYIVLGVLYESLAHPLTIISTLPSAGLGALVALRLAGMELTVFAFIGIILLIGIVKKNGIMLVDFALEGERQRGLAPVQAIYEACLERFRPILMTTLAALLGALPLVIAAGPGSELRRPLGVAIVGGLIVSQVLTLYTTPVIYLLLDRLHRRLGGGTEPREARPVAPAAAE